MVTPKHCQTIPQGKIEDPADAQKLAKRYRNKVLRKLALNRDEYINWACAKIWRACALAEVSKVKPALKELDDAKAHLKAAQGPGLDSSVGESDWKDAIDHNTWLIGEVRKAIKLGQRAFSLGMRERKREEREDGESEHE